MNPAASATAGRAAGAAPARLQAAGLALVGLELAAVLAVVWQYQLESRTFFDVMLLASGGFVVHALLPQAWRLGFFVALSFAAVVVAFGAADAAWLIGFGLVLIGICHLPLAMRWRVVLLLACGGLFALFRSEVVRGPWGSAIWPILGSMFMFRIALYLHALAHEETRPTPARTLAYFFMLPNVCFPLYPVVDYLGFRRNYYDRDAGLIYETGVKWIVRGLVQLVLYRYVYTFLTLDAMELRSLGDLVQFLLSTFGLYLRVSGQFHLICGMLYLFGFRLPETHHLYFLASSFTDFWRRINIYWKDFMMKLVYYPSFFALKKHGTTFALAGATVVVFFGTWILHSYQWFWLRGGFPLEPQDALFWGILGALVVAGSLREMKRPASRKLGAKPAAGWSFSRAWRTVATFTAICVLWSLWSAESVVGWLLMWTAAGSATPAQVLVLLALLAGGFVVAGRHWDARDTTRDAALPLADWRRWLPLASLALLLGIGAFEVYAPHAPRLAATIAGVQRSTLNTRDAALQQKGYYENLDNASRMSVQLWGVTGRKPADWIHLGDTAAYKVRHDFVRGELVPSASITFNGQPLSTNSRGMRDAERTVDKRAGTYRIAVLGPSLVMGSGVRDDETFTRVLEQRLNAAGDGVRYEVLNFGIAAYALTQQLAILDERVFRFGPDAVVFTDSPYLVGPATQHLLHALGHRWPITEPALARLLSDIGVTALARDGVAVPFDAGRALFEAAGVKTRMPWIEADRRLRQAGDRIVRATLDEMALRVRATGAVPVFLALNGVSDPPAHDVPALRDAAAAGMVVFDLYALWRGRDQDALRIASWDNHPNPQGNRVVAERLHGLVREHAVALRLPQAAAAAPAR